MNKYGSAARQSAGRRAPRERHPIVLGATALSVAATLGLALPCQAAAQAPGLRKEAISVGGGMAAANRTYAYYVSSKANAFGYNMVVYALHDDGQTAEDFAARSGWIKVAEDNGFVVVFPEAANKTWSPFSGDNDAYLKAVVDHASTHMTFPAEQAGGSQEGPAVRPAAPARVGTWQPWQYFTGVGSGARAVQEFAINNPGLVTAVATLDGMVFDAAYAKGQEPAQGYLENQRGGKTVAPVWQPLKRDVAVPAWLMTSTPPTAAEAKLSDYWKRSNAVDPRAVPTTIDGFQTALYANPANRQEQVRLTTVPASTSYDQAMASAIWTFFSHVARWTSSPNGDIGPMMTEAEVNKTFDLHTTNVLGAAYKYYVKTPSTYAKGQSLPVVLALHGAGFPAWMYLNQVRMHDVGEKEGFITVYLNGQRNFWDFTQPEGRDSKFIEQVIDEVAKNYGADRSRIYLQGFSFGSGMTYVEGLTHPRLFAAISPNSGIGDLTPAVKGWISDMKTTSDMRMPTIVVYGSVDSASSTDGLVPARGVLRNAIDDLKAFNHITTPDRVVTYDSQATRPYEVLVPGARLTRSGIDVHYKQGRFQRYDYVSADPTPLPLLSWVWVVDLPHGTEPRSAQIEWDYFKNWRRNADGGLSRITP